MLLIEHWYPRKYSVTCTFTILIVIVIGVVHPHVQERRGGIEHHRRAPVHVADRALVPEEVFGDLHVYDLARHGAQDDVAAAGMLCTTLSAHLAMVTRFSNSPAARQSYGMEFTLQAALRNPAVCRAHHFQFATIPRGVPGSSVRRANPTTPGFCTLPKRADTGSRHPEEISVAGRLPPCIGG